MRILIAPDRLKGSLKSPANARAMAAGARRAAPEAEILELPVGDGGEGTLDALVTATGGEFRSHTVTGPLSEPVQARLGLLGDGESIWVEMAEASGLSLVPRGQLDPRGATTYGTGELIRAAFETGRRRVLIGIGGSATTDGGAGAVSALGARFLDARGTPLPPGGAALSRLARIDTSALALPEGRELVVACDVTNPLTGPNGAAAVYGPQKGATTEDIRVLDQALSDYAVRVGQNLGKDWSEAPGAGAAGGLGFALLAFLGARMERGVDLVLETVRFAERLQGTTLVLTGEGRIDRQTTAFGKTLTGIGVRARAAGVPVLALAGSLGEDLGDYRAAGITGLNCVVPRPMPLEDAMRDAAELVEEATRRMLEIFLAGGCSRSAGE